MVRFCADSGPGPMRLCAARRGEASHGGQMPEEITFHNDPVDPPVEFRKQHNHFCVAQPG